MKEKNILVKAWELFGDAAEICFFILGIVVSLQFLFGATVAQIDQRLWEVVFLGAIVLLLLKKIRASYFKKKEV